MTDVAVVGFAQSPCQRHGETTTSGVEMLVPIFHEVLESTGLVKADIGFWCSGSSDYLAGRATRLRARAALARITTAAPSPTGAQSCARSGSAT